MTDNTGSGFMGNATSGIGQGLAFILPESKSATYAMQLAQTHSSQLQDMAKQKKAQQLKEQQEYESSFQAQKLPKISAPFVKMFSKMDEDWKKKAADYHVNSGGKSPFSNPEMMADYNDTVIAGAAKANDLWTNYTKQRSIAETDPTNKYTKESKKKVIDYEQHMMDNPEKSLDEKLPQLVENPKTVNDMIKTLKVNSITNNDGRYETKMPNSSNHKAQAFSALMQDPQYHDILKGYGYNPDLPDFGVYTDANNANGKRVWYTNDAFTGHQADLILSAPEDPKNADILNKIGIHPGDQYAKEKLQHVITDQNSAIGKAVTDIGGRMDSEVPTERKRVYSEERMDISEGRYNLAIEKAQKANDKNDAPTVRQDLIERARIGTKDQKGIGAGEEIKAIVAANSSFNGELKIGFDPKNKNIQTFTVPERTISGGNVIPEHVVKLDTTKPSLYQAGMNQLLNDITGEHVSLSKAISQHGKGFVPGGQQNPTINNSHDKSSNTHAFEANGKTYNIPPEKMDSFLKAFPKAKKVK
jgi:hypothetical protein